MGRQENIEVFEDTVYVYNRNLTLIRAIEWGIENQQIFPEGREDVGKQAHNPPAVVAQAMKTVVQEYRKSFETIEFAVYCSPRDDENYRVFQQILGGL